MQRHWSLGWRGRWETESWRLWLLLSWNLYKGFMGEGNMIDHISPEMLQQLPMASDTKSQFLSLETSLLCLTLTYYSACFCPCPSHTSCSRHVGLLEPPMCTMLSHTRPTFAHAAPPLWGALILFPTISHTHCAFEKAISSSYTLVSPSSVK